MKQLRFFIAKESFAFSLVSHVPISLNDLSGSKTIHLFNFTNSIHKFLINVDKSQYDARERWLNRNYV